MQSSLWSRVTLTRRLENLSTSLLSSASVATFSSASALARFAVRFANYWGGENNQVKNTPKYPNKLCKVLKGGYTIMIYARYIHNSAISMEIEPGHLSTYHCTEDRVHHPKCHLRQQYCVHTSEGKVCACHCYAYYSCKEKRELDLHSYSGIVLSTAPIATSSTGKRALRRCASVRHQHTGHRYLERVSIEATEPPKLGRHTSQGGRRTHLMPA